jgi:hypothetical protein
MSWILFKDQAPPNSAVFVTDFVSVWVREPSSWLPWGEFAKDNPNYAWRDIPKPLVPKRPSLNLMEGGYFPPPWELTEDHKEKTAGWIEFQKMQRSGCFQDFNYL